MTQETSEQPFPSLVDSPKFRPWRELAVAGIMIMELSWGTPWFRSLTQATYALTPVYTFVVFSGIWLASYGLVKALTWLRLKLSIRRGAMGVLLVAGAFAGLKLLLYNREVITFQDLIARPLYSFSDAAALIPDEFIILLAVLLIWRRGAVLAQENIGPAIVLRAFQIGVFMFVGFVFFNTLVTGETIGDMLLVFLFSGLLGLGAARVAVIGRLRGGRKSPFDRRWLVGLLASVIGAVGLAAVVASLVGSGDSLIGFLPRMFIGLIIALVFILATPIFLLSWYLLYAIVQALDVDSPVMEALQNMMDNLQNLISQLSGLVSGHLGFLKPILDKLAIASPIIKALTLWTILIGVGVAILLSLVIQERIRKNPLNEDSQYLLEKGGLLKLLRRNWQKRLKNAAASLGSIFNLQHQQRLMAAARVRRIYTQLMFLCEDLHNPRPESKTPLEFLPTLLALFPAQKPEVSTITQAYVRVRYGELPETRQEILTVEKAWEQVKAQGQVLKQALKKE